MEPRGVPSSHRNMPVAQGWSGASPWFLDWEHLQVAPGGPGGISALGSSTLSSRRGHCWSETPSDSWEVGHKHFCYQDQWWAFDRRSLIHRRRAPREHPPAGLVSTQASCRSRTCGGQPGDPTSFCCMVLTVNQCLVPMSRCFCVPCGLAGLFSTEYALQPGHAALR